MDIVFVNGEYVNSTDARISVFDRGLLFGDAIYEVLPVYNGQPFFIDRHLERLNSNLKKIKIPAPDYDWYELIQKLITRNHGVNMQIYLQVTRGNQGLRTHDIPSEIIPTVIAFPIHNHYPSPAEREKGFRAKLLEDFRWTRCDIKSTSLLANILLNDEAHSSGFQTTILVRNDMVTEGSTANVFIVTPDNEIRTPPLNGLCLPGITRQIAIELIADLQWRFSETEITTADLFEAQEVWIASTTKEIMPVTMINDTLINHGHMGRYCRTLNNSFSQLIS